MMTKDKSLPALRKDIAACRLCEAHLPLGPRPVVRFSATARLVIVGQAPGVKVHESGVPWQDNSGDRLRQWLDIAHEDFYDADKVALVPMGFCYPGKGKSGDQLPRKECAPKWHGVILERLPVPHLMLLVGSYAQKHYLPDDKRGLTDKVKAFREFLPGVFPLPHPSWRSTKWMQDNPWFETEVLPTLRGEVKRALRGKS